MEEQIKQFMKEQSEWQEPSAILSSAPGVGLVTTATLLADLPELGKLDGKKIAGLGSTMGLYPYTNGMEFFGESKRQ